MVAKAIVTVMMMVTVAVVPMVTVAVVFMVATTRADVGRLFGYAWSSFCRHSVVRSIRCGNTEQRGCTYGNGER